MSRRLYLRAILGTSAAAFAPSLPVDAQDVTQLPPVEVAADKPEPEGPGARTTINRNQINLVPPLAPSDILRDAPGVWTQDPNSPGLSISIRGMSDFGRVNVMIDGARQNFQSSGHNANGTVFIDPQLLAGVDISRGAITGTGGSGEIAGVVNLRTIGVDDVVPAGQAYGALGTLMGGTNHYDASGMMAVGMRASPEVGVVGAFSTRSGGNYESGNGVIQPGTAQKLYSGLFKVETKPGVDQTLTLGGVFYANNYGGSTEGVGSYTAIQSNTLTANYGWHPGDNRWADLNAKIYFTETQDTTVTDAFFGTSFAPKESTNVKIQTFGLAADNTSRGTLGPVALALNYGAEYFHDGVSSGSDVAAGTATQTPSGDRQVGGGFIQATATYGIVSLIPGVRLDGYSLTGSGTNTYPFLASAPVGPFSVNNSAGAASPKVTLSVKPVTGLELYGSYGDGWRPPALTETLWAGAHPGLAFLRFIPNPNLTPESTNGWELGAKAAYAHVLQPDDKVTVKADYFYNNIDNYIAQTLAIGRPLSGRTPAFLYSYQNVAGTTVSQGLELEAAYDSGPAFGRIAYSNILTSLPASAPLATGSGQIPTQPPRNVFTTTVGARFLEQKLTIGGRVTVVSESSLNGAPSGLTTAASVPGYAVFDIFSQYKVNDQIKVFANVQNIGNNNYRTDVLSPTYAPGLTALFGVTVQLGYTPPPKT